MDVDPALVRACQRGEPGALDTLVRATYADVYALCRRMLANPDEAADATQEVYLRLTRSVLGFRGDSAFGTWLHRVTVNVCLTALRRRTKAGEAGMSASVTPFGVPGDPRAERLSGDEAGPEERAERGDLAARCEAALELLPADSR